MQMQGRRCLIFALIRCYKITTRGKGPTPSMMFGGTLNTLLSMLRVNYTS